MFSKDIMTLGLGLEEPWKIVEQWLETNKSPHELHIRISADRGSKFPCPRCGEKCKAHDFREFTWRHLNFFQHHCYLTADVPRVKCPEHGVRRVNVPWAREGSKFTLLFEQAAMTLMREMPVASAARIIETTDKRLWRIVHHYVHKAIANLDLSSLTALGLDETSLRGHEYITVFVDMDRTTRPVIFATPGKGKGCVRAFKNHLKQHGGHADNVLEVVCDMSPSFLSAAEKEFKEAQITVDWFHVVKLFTEALEKVRRNEQNQDGFPKSVRWAILKGQEKEKTVRQQEALQELESSGFATATAYRIKELLRWIRHSTTVQAARWRITHFIFVNQSEKNIKPAKLKYDSAVFVLNRKQSETGC